MGASAATRIAVVTLLLGWMLGATAPSRAGDADTTGHHIARLTQMGEQSLKRGDKKSALIYHNKALRKAKESNRPEQEARALLNIARVLKEEDAGKSLEHLQAALAIARRINHKELQSDIYLAMVEIYKQQENYTEALHALEEHHHLLDSLFLQNKNKELAHERSRIESRTERILLLSILISIVLITLILGLYYRKLKKLNGNLKKSNLVKDKLFSILAHDLRGPAGNISMGIAMIEQGNLPAEEQKKLMSLLRSQSESFSQTLNTLLQWAHGQLTGVENHPSLFDAKAVIKKNLEVLSGQAAQKAISFEDNTPEAFQLFADEAHFDIIIRNLLSNAIKFSHPKGRISIGMEEREEDTVFSVRDEGIGISAGRQKQLNSAGIDVTYGTKGEKGTGLGLLVAKEFVHADGGKIWLTSEEGKGTTFYFSIKKRQPD